MKLSSTQPKIRFHHVGMVVKDISKAIGKYAAALGIDKDQIVVEVMSYVTGNGEMEELKYAFLPLADGDNNFIELVEPITPGPTMRYLAKHGEGLNHLALETSKVSEIIEQFQNAGFPLAGKTPTEENLSVFFHPKYTHGVLIQIIKQGIFDNTGKVSPDYSEKEDE